MTFTKERLLKIKTWRETYGPESNVVLPAEEAEALAEIALAALESRADAEPVSGTQFRAVADLYSIAVPGGRSVTYSTDAAEASDFRAMGWAVQEYVKLEMLQDAYTRPQPAPVSVPGAVELDDDFDSAFEHGKAVGWNNCRAAMLNGGKS